jgi:hypothetical protein
MTEEAEPTPGKPSPGDEGRRIAQVLNVIGRVDAPNSIIASALENAQSATKGAVRATGPLNRNEVRTALKHYLRPDCFKEAAHHLRTDHVVILTGRHGLGKRTGALSLLDELASESLVEFPHVVSLRALAEHPYKRGYGYLVCSHQEDGDTAGLEFAWQTIRGEVREAGAHLVVTVDNEPGRHRLEQVRQITWQAPDPADYLAQHLPRDAVARIMVEFDGFRTMTDLARIAAHRTVTGALDELRASSIEPIRTWFAEPKPREAVLDLTALCFLAGISERLFERLLQRLADLLAEHIPEGTEDQPSDPETVLPRGRRRRVIEDGLVSRMKGSLGRTVLDFAVTDYRAEALAQLSKWYSSPFWDALRSWLAEVVEEADEELRTTVAQGLSLLAQENWEEVEASYLQPWSRYELGWAGQETVTYLLWLMSCEEHLAPSALRTAVQWANSQIIWQRWTSAIVFSGVLGMRYPTEAVRRLWSIAVHGNELAKDSLLALAGLFSSLVGQGENPDPVLNLLDIRLREYGHRGADRRLHDLTMNAVLSVLSAVPDQGDSRPSVIALLSQRANVSPRIAGLLATVLCHRPFRLRAMEALANMLAALGRDKKRGRDIAYRLCIDLASALPSHEHPHLNREFAALQNRLQRPEMGSLGDVLRAALVENLHNPEEGTAEHTADDARDRSDEATREEPNDAS